MDKDSRFRGASIIGSRSFTENDQLIFAAATGDHNPMHMDPLAARRTQAGAPVVHGIHTLLWLLERISATYSEPSPVATVKVQFRKMIHIGDKVEAVVTQRNASSLRVEAVSEGETGVSVVINFGKAAQAASVMEAHTDVQSAPLTPCEVPWQELATKSGRLAFAPGSKELEQLFPQLARWWGPDRVAALGCTSLLVGMVVPGLHSIYGGLNFHWGTEGSSERYLTFKVTSIDPRFRLVQEDFSGGGIFGSIDSFHRHSPTRQATMDEVSCLVPRDAFSGATALIVGGSRGLGELTAKIITAGGGKVILTYAVGKAEAENVRKEILTWGGECLVVRYDAMQDAVAQLAAIAEIPTHYYYFATPPIAAKKSRGFSQNLFNHFNAFYVTGFDEVIKAGLGRRPKGIRAFYPSSVFVESPPPGLTAYVMSKAAGEVLCADMNANMGNIQVFVSRLPRMLTDQTASLQDLKTEDALAVMVPIVQKVQATGDNWS